MTTRRAAALFSIGERRVGAIVCAAMLAGCSGSDSTSTHGPGAPRIDQFSVTPVSGVEPGMQLLVSYSFYDDAGVTHSSIKLFGAATQEREQNEGGIRSASRSVAIAIPANASLDVPLRVSLEVFNAAGKSDSVASPGITLVDNTAPHVAGGLLAADGSDASTVAQMATPVGDVVRIRVLASDNHQLAWVGWRLGAPANHADSVAVSSAQGRDSSVVAVAASWVGASPLVIFARDAAGHLTEVEPPVNELMVYPSRSVSLRRAALGRMPLDYAYDDVHDRLIVLLDDSTTIYTVPLGTFAPDAAVHLPEPSAGLDVTPGGDSLLFTMPHSNALGVLAIGAPVSDIARVPITFDASIGPGPERVKVASNGNALISIAALTGTAPYRFITLDRGTGAQRKRTDATPLASGGGTLLVRSLDRQRILAIYGGGCCYGAGFFYEAARDGFLASPALDQLGPGEPTSADSRGSAFLIGSRYVGGDLFTPRTINAPQYTDFYYSATTISPDGTLGYFARGNGYSTIRLSDGTVLEAVLFTPAPNEPNIVAYRLIALPDGRMAGWSTSAELFLLGPR
jgi:hypothetical protein